MRVFHFGGCLAICLVATLAFLFGGFASGNVRTANEPVWTRMCDMTRESSRVKLVCGDFEKTANVEDALVASLIVPRTVACMAYETHGPLHQLRVECS